LEAIVTLAALRIVVCRSATVSAPRTDVVVAAMRTLAREFPSVAVGVGEAPDPPVPAVALDVDAWSDRRRPFEPFDEAVEAHAASTPAATLMIRGAAELAAKTALEALTRFQWLVGRRNPASSGRAFGALLARIETLHDRTKPLVRADYVHAIDTWQWLLRLDPAAGAAVQMASLLHDVERLESEADARIEHHAPDYLRFKLRHARRGGQIARDVLAACGVDEVTRERAVGLVEEHETPGADPCRALLNDADALSFFSRNSAGYADYFGPAQTRQKVAYTLGRMRPSARARLATVRVRADVGAAIAEVEAAAGRAVEASP
jgi:hypothetical protein